MDPTPKPPSETNVNLTMAAKIGGAILMLLCYGYQSAQKDHPDVISALGSSVDYAAVFSFVGVVAAAMMGRANATKAKIAFEAEKSKPPADEHGDRCAHCTLKRAIGQAAEEDNHDLVESINDLLRKLPVETVVPAKGPRS